MEDKGSLFLVPTPIGNLGDMTFRAVEVLRQVDYILCEDTRNSIKLLNHFEIKSPMLSYHKHNEKMRTEEIIDFLKEGKNIALITDAGCPCISDPGSVIVDKAHEEKIKIVSLPGASATITAIQASGMDSSVFQFIGFLPRQKSKKTEMLNTSLNYKGLTVLYESPNRLLETLSDIKEFFPSRRVLVARELTKLHEELFRGRVEEAIEHFSAGQVKGEIAIVMEAYFKEEKLDSKAYLEELIAAGMKPSLAVKEVSKRLSVSKNEIYRISLEIKEK